MNEELRKSLSDLIDETLIELEELKKSRYAASEIDLKGPGEGIAGKPSNGDLHAKKADDDKKDKDKKDEDDDAMKAEGKNKESDPGAIHHGVGGDAGHKPYESPNSGKSHGSGKNSESDPGDTHHNAAEKAEKADKDDDEDDKKKKDKKDDKDGDDKKPPFMKADKSPSPEQADKAMRSLAKSDEELEGLMKSFVEERVRPLEDKLSTILNLVNKIAEQPVPAKGTTANAVPLMKSSDEAMESLSKSDIATKLFELKKSGTKVDSLDITRAEMGHDLHKIVQKYKIS